MLHSRQLDAFGERSLSSLPGAPRHKNSPRTQLPPRRALRPPLEPDTWGCSLNTELPSPGTRTERSVRGEDPITVDGLGATHRTCGFRKVRSGCLCPTFCFYFPPARNRVMTSPFPAFLLPFRSRGCCLLWFAGCRTRGLGWVHPDSPARSSGEWLGCSYCPPPSAFVNKRKSEWKARIRLNSESKNQAEFRPGLTCCLFL